MSLRPKLCWVENGNGILEPNFLTDLGLETKKIYFFNQLFLTKLLQMSESNKKLPQYPCPLLSTCKIKNLMTWIMKNIIIYLHINVYDYIVE